VVYYYNRERRLRRASAAVRELNRPGGGRPGLARGLLGNRSNIFLLVAVLMVCAMYLLTSRLSGPDDDGLELAGNRVALSISAAGDAPALKIVKTAPRGAGAYAGPVGVAVSPLTRKPSSTDAAGYSIVTEAIFFSAEDRDDIVVALPAAFAGEELIVILQAEDARASQIVKPAR